jgi:large subunit ribosomal protein L17
MRHRKRNAKLGRKGDHRNAMLANLVCSLIKHKRVTTTLAKAKAARPVAEKLVTLGKREAALKAEDGKAPVYLRRLAAARLRQNARTLHKSKEDRLKWRENEDVVRILFDDITPGFSERLGGYTRIIKLHRRQGDAAEMAILEWVEAGDSASGSSTGVEVKEVTEAPAAEAEEAKAETAAEETAEEETKAAEPAASAEEEAPAADEASEDEEKKKD